MFNYYPHYSDYSRYDYPHYPPKYYYNVNNHVDNLTDTAFVSNSYSKKEDKKRDDSLIQSSSCDKRTASSFSSDESKSDFENPTFEIFGLKLYFDDVLLLCLIFFLYSEGNKDPMLFISLILLLMS